VILNPPSVDVTTLTDIGSATYEGRGYERGVWSPVGVSFSAGLPKSPPNVDPPVAVEVPIAVPSCFSPSLGRPNGLLVVLGMAGVEVPDGSVFLTSSKLAPNTGVVVEVEVEVVVLSTGLGGSEKNTLVAGVVVVV